MTGFAESPFGVNPFGLGTPATASAPPDPPLQARYLSPLDRDYQLDSNGEYERMPETRQRVLLALMTRKGSSTVLPEMGSELPDKIDNAALTRMRQSVDRALAFLVTEGAIRVDEVTLESDKVGRLIPNVRYVDLRTQQPDKLAF